MRAVDGGTTSARVAVYGKDPVAAGSHFVGLLLAVAGLVALVRVSPAEPVKVASFAIYGGSLVALFLASSVYHFLDLGPRGNRWLRRFDHSAIFLLIAGTYMPVLLLLLEGSWRVSMVAVVGGFAVLGVAFKMLWIGCPRWIGTLLYLGMGWLAVIPGPVLLPRMPEGALSWLAAGGAAYTVGAVVYATKRPDPWPGRFGFHEIWHLFVLAGAAGHYVLVLHLVDVSPAPF